MADWLSICLCLVALIAAIGFSLLRAREYGVTIDESLLFWQRPLIAGKQAELRQLVPENLKRKQILKAFFPFKFEYLVFLIIFGNRLIRLFDNTILSRMEELTGNVFVEPSFVLIYLLLLPPMIRQSIARLRTRGGPRIELFEPLAFGPIQRAGALSLILLLLFFFSLNIYFSDAKLTTFFLGLVLLFTVPAIFLYYFSVRSRTQLRSVGYVGPFQYIPWKKVLNYRWYDDRTGILFLVDHWSASPLLILPVPDGKAGSVQALLDDVLPGKREEDVEPALARLSSDQMAEVV